MLFNVANSLSLKSRVWDKDAFAMSYAVDIVNVFTWGEFEVGINWYNLVPSLLKATADRSVVKSNSTWLPAVDMSKAVVSVKLNTSDSFVVTNNLVPSCSKKILCISLCADTPVKLVIS